MQTAKWFGNNFYNKNLKDSYNELTHNNAVDGLVVKDLVTELQIRKSYKSISGELTKSLDAFTNLECLIPINNYFPKTVHPQMLKLCLCLRKGKTKSQRRNS